MDRRLRRPRKTEDLPAAAPPTSASLLPISSKRAGSITTRTRASPSGIVKVAPPVDQDLRPRTRRSSRGPPTVAAAAPPPLIKASVKVPTPIREVPEVPSPVRQSTSNLPMTLTTNTSSRAPNKSLITNSVNSNSFSTTTTTTTSQHILIQHEGDTGGAEVDTESIRKRLTERLRRSVSKTISNLTNTEGSRYSRSVSRSVYGEEDDGKSSKRSYSTGIEEDSLDEEDDVQEDNFKSFQRGQTASPQLNVDCRKLQTPREFGGWLGAVFLLLFVPSWVYYLTWSCTSRNSCQFKRVNLTALVDWSYLGRQVFQNHVIGVYVAYQVVVFLLVALLPGRRVHLTRETYTFNALGVAVTLLLAGGLAEYLKYPVVNFVLRHYLRFCIYGLISAFVAALWSYWRVDTTKYNVLRQTLTNDYGRSGEFMIDFALGRQLNPKWLGRVDWKQYYYRLSMVTTLIYASCYIYQILQWPKWPVAENAEEEQVGGFLYLVNYFYQNVNYDKGSLLCASCLLAYILDAIIFEHHLSSSFELQHEGYGCLLLLRYASTPYLLSGVTKYFYEQRVPITCWYAPIGVVLLLLVGLFVKRFSCAYKYKYRLNSQSPIFANIETIHTYQGSRLLLSGLWGHLRQPNYLGDIIALVALGTPMVMRPAWPPLLGLALLVLVLLHRATRANVRNQERYHSSWHRYCSQVRYYILPKIF
ncbi:uncharacterized protein Dwil_GK15926 [Drosophila willistoni]|uniref:Lamin-B receptor n=1 Tax=Drosophila willistoni TaxID=7260 RepID=B4MS08_DROWI|nr:lamin-B receptor [Drosophila willistoni]EDW74897.1 uncharacterized protein Dwil_GK15926 [Drosophila willistoni]